MSELKQLSKLIRLAVRFDEVVVYSLRWYERAKHAR